MKKMLAHTGRGRSSAGPLLIGAWILALCVFWAAAGSATVEPSPVSFSSTDGVPLKGYLFGSGRRAVILAHMYPTDQRSWFDFAKVAAARGFTAMTFDFRGYGESSGTKEISKIDRDLEGAYLFLKPRAETIFLVGASMGGTASLIVASRRPVAGVISLSGPASFRGLDALQAIEKVTAPCLFIAAENDPGQAASSARLLYDRTKGRKDLLILPGAEHGTFLFDGPHKESVEKRIFGFMSKP